MTPPYFNREPNLPFGPPIGATVFIPNDALGRYAHFVLLLSPL